MTDSGAFQQHAYGSVEVTPEEILAFQERDRERHRDRPRRVHGTRGQPGGDRGRARGHGRTVLDGPGEPRPGLLAVPVQGGSLRGP